jgi:hypothetical protein
MGRAWACVPRPILCLRLNPWRRNVLSMNCTGYVAHCPLQFASHNSEVFVRKPVKVQFLTFRNAKLLSQIYLEVIHPRFF